MVTGTGLIGKLALFLGEKLLSHQLNISLDEKKRTCRAFVELYYCLDRLEEVNLEVMDVLATGIKHGGILLGDLELVMPAVNTVSQRFLDIRGELYHAINVIDPLLASSVRQIYAAKGSFLMMLSDSVRYSDRTQNGPVIKYMAPDPRILEIDMESYKSWVEHYSHAEKFDKNNLEWPQSLLWHGEYEEGFHPARLILTDSASLQKLHDVLATHGAVLSSAREKMREFVAKNFDVQDILYVSKGMERE